MNELTEQARRVNELRKAKASAEERYKRVFDEFQMANVDLLFERKELAEATLDAEQRLRDATVATYKETGNKHPAPGLGIRESEKPVYDLKEAEKWALAHKLALKLDVKVFEKIATDVNLPFVQWETEVTATISTDLDKALDATKKGDK